jgi:hypothetical protein
MIEHFMPALQVSALRPYWRKLLYRVRLKESAFGIRSHLGGPPLHVIPAKAEIQW